MPYKELFQHTNLAKPKVSLSILCAGENCVNGSAVDVSGLWDYKNCKSLFSASLERSKAGLYRVNGKICKLTPPRVIEEIEEKTCQAVEKETNRDTIDDLFFCVTVASHFSFNIHVNSKHYLIRINDFGFSLDSIDLPRNVKSSLRGMIESLDKNPRFRFTTKRAEFWISLSGKTHWLPCLPINSTNK